MFKSKSVGLTFDLGCFSVSLSLLVLQLKVAYVFGSRTLFHLLPALFLQLFGHPLLEREYEGLVMFTAQ